METDTDTTLTCSHTLTKLTYTVPMPITRHAYIHTLCSLHSSCYQALSSVFGTANSKSHCKKAHLIYGEMVNWQTFN